MRIAFFTDTFLPQINGVVSYVLDNATELVKRGHNVTVFAPKPALRLKSTAQFPFRVIYVPSVPALVYPDYRLSIPSLPRILLHLKKLKIELLHLQDPFTICSEGMMAAKILKIPTIITFHTFFMDEQMLADFKLGRFTPYIQTPIWKLTAYYHNLSSAIICPSKISQTELTKNGLKRRSIHIPNGMYLDNIHPLSKKNRDLQRMVFGITPTDLVGIYVGRLATDKSIDVLLRVWKQVVEHRNDAKLLLVGSGPDEDSLKSLVNELGIGTHVVFVGAMKRSAIFESGILSLADVFVTASQIENLSYSMIEAMAFGLPIIAVDKRGAAELVGNENGILVPADNKDLFTKAILSLYSDEKRRKELSCGALEKVKLFDIKKTSLLLEETYQSVLKDKRKMNIL